jgi:hypothetical protein
LSPTVNMMMGLLPELGSAFLDILSRIGGPSGLFRSSRI